MITPWFIYTLSDPIDYAVRYVGITTQPKIRLQQHIARTRIADCRTPSILWMKGVLLAGRVPVLAVVHDGVDDPSGTERQFISEYKARGCALLNVLLGGGAAIDDEYRAAASARMKGRQFSDEHRRRISEAKMGGKRPDMAIVNKAIGITLRGKKLNISAAERLRRSVSAKSNAARNSMLRWSNMTEEVRAAYGAAVSAQMKRVWKERHAAINKDAATGGGG